MANITIRKHRVSKRLKLALGTTKSKQLGGVFYSVNFNGKPVKTFKNKRLADNFATSLKRKGRRR